LTFGHYIDDINAVYKGEFAVPIGINNSTLVDAIKNQPRDGWGEKFEAFVIPKSCETMKYEIQNISKRL